MILYIVTETYDTYKQNFGNFKARNRLEMIAGDACVVLHCSQVDLRTVKQIEPWAICHSGSSRDAFSTGAYGRMVMQTDVAQMGFCGGHQIIATLYHAKIGPMRKLAPDESDPNPAYRPGRFKESGLYTVRVIKADPLFKGLGRKLRVMENHTSEVKRLPPSLVLLASSRTCRVQVFRHRTKPIYGTQFHPEADDTVTHDGQAILTNFFRIAKMHQESLGRPVVQNQAVVGTSLRAAPHR
jgi:GMP synthase-like glutamine amidotransferase